MIATARRAAGAARAVRRGIVERRDLVASALRPYRPTEGGRPLLDDEYGEGVWDYLADDRELPRFGVVASYCLRHARDGRILEIGCGEGLLAERLGTERCAAFVGVDVSETAVRRAEALALPNARFVTADATTFDPGDTFDVIVFHEMLEYLDDPIGCVQRYERWLADDGHIVVSQYRSPNDARTRKIWRGLRRRYTTVGRARVTTAARFWWTIEVLVPVSRERRRR